MPKKRNSIIKIEGDRLIFENSDLSKSLKFNYPADTVRDLEILDAEKLEEGIHTFITKNEISAGSLLLVRSKNITFQTSISSSNIEQERTAFLDSIPFETISSKIYGKKDSQVIVATNRDLVQKFQSIFVHLGFQVEGVVPEELLPENYSDLYLKKSTSYSHLSMAGNSGYKETKINKIAKKEIEASKNLRLLLTLFGFSFLVLGGAYYYSHREYDSAKVSEVVIPDLIGNPSGIPTNTLSDPSTLSVKILYRPQEELSAKELQSILWSSGFKNTDLVATTSAGLSTNLSLSPNLPPDLIQKIQGELSKIDKNYTVDSLVSENSEVTILLAKSSKKR